MDRVQARALIERHVRETPASLPRLEYLMSGCLPITEADWSPRRAEAFLFLDFLEADKLAHSLSTPERFVFPVVVTTPQARAETVPPRYRKERHDWHTEAANSGVL